MKTENTVRTINNWEPEVRSLIYTLIRNGFTPVSVDNGETETRYTEDAVNEFISEAIACDEATLICLSPERKRVGLYLVLGNAPGELVCDYTCHPGLDKVSEEHGKMWFGRPQPTIEV